MSLIGTSQTFWDVGLMSAVGSEAVMLPKAPEVRS